MQKESKNACLYPCYRPASFHYSNRSSLGFFRPINLLADTYHRIQAWTYVLTLRSQQKTIEALQAENLRLTTQNQTLLINKAEFELLQEENENLKNQLEFIKERKLTALQAEIIGRGNNLYGNSFIINRGKSDGVQIGYPIFVQKGILIGKTVTVKENISFVLLLNDNNSKVAASILNKERTLGIVEGELGLSIKMNLIPQNQEVTYNDIVITSGLEESVPRGLIIGTIHEINESSVELFKNASILPPIDYFRNTTVSLVIPQQ